MLKDMEHWIQSLQTDGEKKEAGSRLRKLMGSALQSEDVSTAIAMGGLAARYNINSEGLNYIFASALQVDNRPFSARAALQKELAFFPACKRCVELQLELETTLHNLDLPEHTQYAAMKASNLRYANRHLGQRCFILGNAPSLNNHDLTLLRHDVVFSVSNGYLHPDYSIYKPKYHCLPRIPYSEVRFTKEHTLTWLTEMDSRIGDATLAVSGEEASLLHTHGLCPQRDILPLDFAMAPYQMPANIIDICGPLATVQSVPVMTLNIALYMGFKDVYILGVDHSDLCDRKYVYFYEKSLNTGLEGSVDAEGNLTESNFSTISGLFRLFAQYEEIKKAAALRNVSIFNANPLGLLDTFPRVRYEDLFSGTHQ